MKQKGSQEAFTAASGRHPDLAKNRTPLAVLAVISDYSDQRAPEREALTYALITELQQRPQPLWTAMLLYAYCPLLQRTSGRITVPNMPAEEIDQIVVESFLETTQKLPLQPVPDRLCMRLNQGTRRRVFRHLHREHRFQETNQSLEYADIEGLVRPQPELDEAELLSQSNACLWPEPRPSADPPVNHQDQSELAGLLIDLAGDHLADEQLEILITTLVRGETISSLARCLYQDQSPPRQKQAYQRLKRRHSRALAKLRSVISESDLSPNLLHPFFSGRGQNAQTTNSPREDQTDEQCLEPSRGPDPQTCRAGWPVRQIAQSW